MNLLTMHVEFCGLATLSPTVGGSNRVCSIISQADVGDVKLVNLLLNIARNFSVFCVFNFLSIFSPKLKELQI
jgi:hypothetical protein